MSRICLAIDTLSVTTIFLVFYRIESIPQRLYIVTVT